MSELSNLAVLFVRHDKTQVPPTIDECKQLLRSEHGPFTFWSENSDRWIDFSDAQFFGWYDITLPPAESSRTIISDQAYTAATTAKVNLSGFRRFMVVFFPAGDGIRNYDAGTANVRPNDGRQAATVSIESDCTFMCHELGHALGFDHSYGILNHGVDWNHTGITAKVYGDPYDIMSSASFGDARPVFTIPEAVKPAFSGFRNSAGPMLARAQLHFFRRDALEANRRVVHVTDLSSERTINLFTAGHWAIDKPTLVVVHPEAEDQAGRGRVYIELRTSYLAKWDNGLANAGDTRTRWGTVVHAVENAEGSNTPAVWYKGRIVPESIDRDIDVALGSSMISISSSISSIYQDSTYITIKKKSATIELLTIYRSSKNDTKVVRTETRYASVPPFTKPQPFSWEFRDITTTTTFALDARNLGGTGNPDVGNDVLVNWQIAGQSLKGSNGTALVQVPDVGSGTFRQASIIWQIDAPSQSLICRNQPGDGALAIEIKAIATGTSHTATSTYEAPAHEEGWGEDYQRYMEYLWYLTHPIPIPPIGPVPPSWPIRQWQKRTQQLKSIVAEKNRFVVL